MRRAPWSQAIGAVQKVLLVHRSHNHGYRTLQDLVGFLLTQALPGATVSESVSVSESVTVSDSVSVPGPDPITRASNFLGVNRVRITHKGNFGGVNGVSITRAGSFWGVNRVCITRVGNFRGINGVSITRMGNFGRRMGS